jgi:hypothetical protein
MPRVIVCDVNETLLDVGALEPHFKQAFGDGRVLQDWFANVLLYSEVATLAGPYSDFASIGGHRSTWWRVLAESRCRQPTAAGFSRAC